MREIKFRLIKDGQIVGYERWNPEYRRWEYMACDPQGITPKGAIWMQPEIGYIDHDSKDWFTGLRDKNGWEIYEWDIVDTCHKDTLMAEIVYDHCGFCFKWLNKRCVQVRRTEKEPIFHNVSVIFEVIGNIHDNPDLLKDVIPCKE